MARLRSLGTVDAVERGLLITGATNATPIAATITSGAATNTGHRLKTGDRITAFGTTGNTAANGMWTFTRTAATTGTFDGSVGNGAPTLTNSVVALLFDRTPFMRGHFALARAKQAADLLPSDLTFSIQGNKEDAASANGSDASILAADATTLSTHFEDCIDTQDPFNIPGSTVDGTWEAREVRLRRHMYLNCSVLANASGLEVDIEV